MDATDSKSKTKLRHDWYQTDSHVIITIFVKNATKDDVQVDFEERAVSLSAKLPSCSEVCANFELWHFVRPDECGFKIYSTKIEIKMKKLECLKWDLLEGQGPGKDLKTITITNPPPTSLSGYPSSSTKKHDWDKFEVEVSKDEEADGKEGDAALNQLFQKIYADGSEEVKRAMNKSFMESGGTVLSTNWNEVGPKQVDVKAPDGMEWKNWEK